MIDGRQEFVGLRVIVVDDDYNTTNVFSELLESTGMKVVGKGYDGMDAVELYKTHMPDVVFLDALMKPYDGFYALEKIRQVNNQAVVIMITADLSSDISSKVSKLKASGLIYKPFDITGILATVKKLITEKLTIQILLGKN